MPGSMYAYQRSAPGTRDLPARRGYKHGSLTVTLRFGNVVRYILQIICRPSRALEHAAPYRIVRQPIVV